MEVEKTIQKKVNKHTSKKEKLLYVKLKRKTVASNYDEGKSCQMESIPIH